MTTTKIIRDTIERVEKSISRNNYSIDDSERYDEYEEDFKKNYGGRISEDTVNRIHSILKKPFFLASKKQLEKLADLITDVEMRLDEVLYGLFKHESIAQSKEEKKKVQRKIELIKSLHYSMFDKIRDGKISNILEFKAFENNLVFLIRLYKAGVRDAKEIAKFYGVKVKDIKETFKSIEKICGKKSKGYIGPQVLHDIYEQAGIFDYTKLVSERYEKMAKILPELKEELEEKIPGLYQDAVKVMKFFGDTAGITFNYPITLKEENKSNIVNDTFSVMLHGLRKSLLQLASEASDESHKKFFMGMAGIVEKQLNSNGNDNKIVLNNSIVNVNKEESASNVTNEEEENVEKQDTEEENKIPVVSSTLKF